MLVITPFLSPLVSRDGRALGYFYNLMKKLAENPSGGKIVWVVDKGFNTLETGGTQFANTEQLSVYFEALKRLRGKPGVADWVFAHSVVVLFDPHRPSIKAANSPSPNFGISHAMLELRPPQWSGSNDFRGWISDAFREVYPAGYILPGDEDITFTLFWSPHKNTGLPEKKFYETVRCVQPCKSLTVFAHVSNQIPNVSAYILPLHTIFGQFLCLRLE